MTKIVIDKDNEITKLDNMLETLTDEKDKQSVRFAINVISGFNEVLSDRPQGDLISREALKHRFAQITYTRFTADMGQGGFEMFSEKEIEDIIDKAPNCEHL